MYLEHYNIKAFFFFVISGKFCHFFDFDAFCFVWWCWNESAFLIQALICLKNAKAFFKFR
ncbi:hypothetical protein ACM23_03815 [Helicobacter pylori]|nr:hypothetical protein ACM23_03815 [Helicobacter pylori]